MRDDGLVEELHKVETIIQDYKTKQDIAGDSWVVYRTVSTNSPYDIYLTGATTSSTFSRKWKATFQIDGARKIPNAFAIFANKINGSITTIDAFGGEIITPTGFLWNQAEVGGDPLSIYIKVSAGYNWTSSPTNTYVGISFRCLSPYKGKIIFEEIY